MLQILAGPLLSERTTLRLGGRALAEVRLTEKSHYDALPQTLQRIGGTPVMLGCGSNILAHGGELPLVVVTPAVEEEPCIVGEDADGVLVRVGAAMRLPRLLGQLANWGLGGLEGLAGIPGSVGGAIAMNAGSYGCEMGAVLDAVEIFSPHLGLVVLGREHFRYGYRHFSLVQHEGWFVVTGGVLRVQRSDKAVIAGAMRSNYLKKKATQPVLAHSAGCVFRNPAPGVSTGKLLDEAGFRGRALGGMAFSEMHANFLVNQGNGTSEEAFELIELARVAVSALHRITVELEVKVLPWQ